jgi:hypothetical protein
MMTGADEEEEDKKKNDYKAGATGKLNHDTRCGNNKISRIFSMFAVLQGGLAYKKE